MAELGHRRHREGHGRCRGAVDQGGRRLHQVQLDGAADSSPRRGRRRAGRGAAAEPIKDRRFAGEAWTKDPRYEAVARTYLAQTDLLRKALDAAPLDERSKAQWGFALRQVTDALSPANNLATNPEAHAARDGDRRRQPASRACGCSPRTWRKGRISMTDETAFEVGRNVGTTPGSVVFQNELIQLIQYTPTTAKVYERPLVIVPPCINKYYILDLQPANSFVAHAVAAGPHGVPGVLAQRRRRAGHADLGRLPRAGRARGDRRGAGDHQRRQGQHARVLRRRHAAGQRARGPGRAAASSRPPA